MGERFDPATIRTVANMADKYNKFQECVDASVRGSEVSLKITNSTGQVVASVNFALTDPGITALAALLNIYAKPLKDTVIANGLTTVQS